METIYHYIIRPAEDSTNSLIEFTDLPEGKDFIPLLVQAFSSIGFTIVDYDDLWMNDEIALRASSRIGRFTIYRDADGFYLISAEDTKAIVQLNDILSRSGTFQEK